MSRTYRRKNADWDRWKGRSKSEYQRDGHMTMRQVPKWYKVEFLRRPFRIRSKAALKRAVSRGEDPVMPVDKKAALYYW